MAKSNTETPVQEETTSVTLIKEVGEGTIGVELDDSNQHTPMFVDYFSSLRDHSVDRSKIYGESLEHLVAQLEFLARMAGTLGFVDKTLGAEMNPADSKLYQNIEESVVTLTEVIVEKFRPIPR
jgi:hypothetical protein